MIDDRPTLSHFISPEASNPQSFQPELELHKQKGLELTGADLWLHYATRNREGVEHAWRTCVRTAYPNRRTLTEESRAHKERKAYKETRRYSLQPEKPSVEITTHGHTYRCFLSPDEQPPEDSYTGQLLGERVAVKSRRVSYLKYSIVPCCTGDRRCGLIGAGRDRKHKFQSFCILEHRGPR